MCDQLLFTVWLSVRHPPPPFKRQRRFVRLVMIAGVTRVIFTHQMSLDVVIFNSMLSENIDWASVHFTESSRSSPEPFGRLEVACLVFQLADKGYSFPGCLSCTKSCRSCDAFTGVLFRGCWLLAVRPIFVSFYPKFALTPITLFGNRVLLLHVIK